MTFCPQCGYALNATSKAAVLKADRHSTRARLTKKEEEAIDGVFRAMTNADIAAQAGTTERVIRNRLRDAYRKLGVRSRTDLVDQAWRQGAIRLWLYAGESYVPPKVKKYETAAEKHAAEVRGRC